MLLWDSKNNNSLLQKLAGLLYKAAADGGYVDPHKVAEILGVPNTRSEVQDNISGKKMQLLKGVVWKTSYTNTKENLHKSCLANDIHIVDNFIVWFS